MSTYLFEYQVFDYFNGELVNVETADTDDKKINIFLDF
jgi:hypothetical protein